MIAGTTYAMPKGGMSRLGGPGFAIGEGLFRFLTGLDLTEPQKHEAALILGRYREEGREKAEMLRAAMEGLRAASQGEKPDEDAIRTAFKEVAASGEEMAVHGAKVIAELKGILTQEQRAALEEQRAHRLEKRRARREHGTSFLDEWIEVYSKYEESQ
jgi:Spy/CpxP family protein refolding chaperone